MAIQIFALELNSKTASLSIHPPLKMSSNEWVIDERSENANDPALCLSREESTVGNPTVHNYILLSKFLFEKKINYHWPISRCAM